MTDILPVCNIGALYYHCMHCHWNRLYISELLNGNWGCIHIRVHRWRLRNLAWILIRYVAGELRMAKFFGLLILTGKGFIIRAGYAMSGYILVSSYRRFPSVWKFERTNSLVTSSMYTTSTIIYSHPIGLRH